MHKIILSGQFPEIINKLKTDGFDCILTQPNPVLPFPVRFHADLQFLKIENKKAFILKNSDFSLDNYTLYKTKENPDIKYPKDCLLNCLITSNKVFGNINALDHNLLDYFKKNNFELIHVNQGYAKCSTLLIDESHAITADSSICKALRENNIDVLKIEQGHIVLTGYDYGFIGGASAKIGDKVIFTGSLKTHPQGTEIENYIKSRHLKILELTASSLIDIGGIIKL